MYAELFLLPIAHDIRRLAPWALWREKYIVMKMLLKHCCSLASSSCFLCIMLLSWILFSGRAFWVDVAFAVTEICSNKLVSCQQEAVNQDILRISNSLEIGCVIHVRDDIYPCYVCFFFSPCFPPANDRSFQTPRLSLILQETRSRSALTLGHAENGGFLQMCCFKH